VEYIWDENSSEAVLFIFFVSLSSASNLHLLLNIPLLPCPSAIFPHNLVLSRPQISQLSHYSGSHHALPDLSFFRVPCYRNGTDCLPLPTWNILTQNNLGFSTRFRRPSLRRRVHLLRKRSTVLRCERHVDSSLRELSSGLRV
jgi:hypothetical protein